MFLLIWLRPVKYPLKTIEDRLNKDWFRCSAYIMSCLCWLASVSLVFSYLFFSFFFFTPLTHWSKVHYPTSISWLFQQVLKRLPCGIVKILIWIICCDCCSDRGEGAYSHMLISLCVVGCDKRCWMDADLCLESITASLLLLGHTSCIHR